MSADFGFFIENIIPSRYLSENESVKSIRRILELDDEVLKKMPKEMAESIRSPFINDLKTPKRFKGDTREDAGKFFSKFDDGDRLPNEHPLDEGIRRAIGINSTIDALRGYKRFTEEVVEERMHQIEPVEEEVIEYVEDVELVFDVDADFLSEVV